MVRKVWHSTHTHPCHEQGRQTRLSGWQVLQRGTFSDRESDFCQRMRVIGHVAGGAENDRRENAGHNDMKQISAKVANRAFVPIDMNVQTTFVFEFWYVIGLLTWTDLFCLCVQ